MLKKVLTLIRKNEKILKQASKQASKLLSCLLQKRKEVCLHLSRLPLFTFLREEVFVRVSGGLIE